MAIGAAANTGFAAVYDRHLDDVHAFFGYRVGSRADAEDLTQQTFERALAAWDRFDPERASARTWLLAIAHNLLVDHHRRRASRPPEEPLEDGIGEEGLGPAPVIDPRLGIEPALAGALGKLSERERTLIALRFGGDLTGPQIAEVAGLTLANVQQLLSRSLRRLRAELGAEVGYAASGPSPATPAAANASSARPDPA